jgi:hypothetical protein
MEQTELGRLGQINVELYELCCWLNERRDLDTASKLIPIVDRLTRLVL